MVNEIGEMGVDENLAKEIEGKLATISRVFDIDRIAKSDFGPREVAAYYTQSAVGYRKFHSTEGSIHMALNFDGEFSKEGYFGQVDILQKQVDEVGAKDVLELACGRGFNVINLARRNPNTQFMGQDLTTNHVREAKSSVEDLTNIRFDQGDFHNLSYSDGSFDIVFAVEGICHAVDMAQVLRECLRVLRPGGRLVVIDGFRRQGFDQLDPQIQLASRLVEASMAVHRSNIFEDWLSLAEAQGFKVVETQDLSQAIMPNLRRFEDLARRYFGKQSISRFAARFLSPYLVRNSIAGYLMPSTIQAGAHSYRVACLSK